jgi:signal peptidase I
MLRKLSIVAAAALFLAWFFLLRPGFLGGPASYIIVAGASMEPTLHTGDLALAREGETYHEGDIVAFTVPQGQPGEGYIVIHRIVGGTPEEGYIVQGDNKESPDIWRPTADDIVGRMWFRVPRGGLYVLSLRQPIVLGAVAGLLGMLFVLSGGEGSPRKRNGNSPPPSTPRWPGGGVLLLGLLVILALSFAAVAVFTLRQPAYPTTEPALFSLFGLHIPVVTAHWLSAVGFAITGGAATGGLVLAMLLSQERGEAARIQARYGSLLINVAEADLKDQHERIRAASIEDLVKLAQRDGRSAVEEAEKSRGLRR